MKVTLVYPFDVMGTAIEIDENDFYAIPLHSRGEVESNKFLLSLWHEMNQSIAPQTSPDRVPWAYTPCRFIENGHSISIMGYVQTSCGDFVVGISYATRGDIDKIMFIGAFGAKLNDEQKRILSQCVSDAMDNRDTLIDFIGSATFTLQIDQFSITPYHSSQFVIYSDKDGTISVNFKLRAIDIYEAKQQAYRIMQGFAAVMSVELNQNLTLRDFDITPGTELPHPEYQTGSMKCAVSYIDGYPRLDEQTLAVSKEGLQFFLNEILSNPRLTPYPSKVKAYLNACKHCKEGLAVADETGDTAAIDIPGGRTFALRDRTTKNVQQKVSSQVLSYMSALECVTATDAPADTCNTCGAPIYKIGSRVKDLAKEYLDDNLASIIKQLYDYRSKFVHTGQVVTDEIRMDNLPMINKSNATCLMDNGGISVKVPGGATMVAASNVREWTTFILRCYCQHEFYGRTDFKLPDPEADTSAAGIPVAESADADSNTSGLFPLRIVFGKVRPDVQVIFEDAVEDADNYNSDTDGNRAKVDNDEIGAKDDKRAKDNTNDIPATDA